MKFTPLLAAASLLTVASARADILISQYYEGSSFNKYIEIHNPGVTPLALTGYRLTLWQNGNAELWKTDNAVKPASNFQMVDLSAITLPAGGYYLFCHNSAAAPAYANSSANTRNGSVINFNGNDSVVIYKGDGGANDTYNVADIVDAISFTNAGNEGVDKSFVRLSDVRGYDTNAGTSVIDYTLEPILVWEIETLDRVNGAVPTDLHYLQAQPPPVPPVLESFVIANDADTTVTPNVLLKLTFSGGNPVDYMIADNPAFTGAAWQTYNPVIVQTLAGAPGLKTLHFKLRNAIGESAALSDSIELGTYAFTGDVVFTQYYEGSSGFNKYVEIANLTNQPIDLATWTIARWTNQDVENWKTTGFTATGTSSSIPLSVVNTDGLGSTMLAPHQVIVIANSQAVAPLPADSVALKHGELSHNGDDTIAIYAGPVDPANLRDVLSFTSGNEGADRSFVRIATGMGFSFAAGSKITDFPAIWEEVTLDTANNALPNQNEYLGTYPGGQVDDGYTAWAAGFPGIGGPESDFDLDGSTNLMEYALGSLPNDASAFVIPVYDGAAKTFTVVKSDEAAIDASLTYIVEGSTNLQTWSSTTDIENGPGNGGTTIVKKYTGSSPVFYFRLKVVRTI